MNACINYYFIRSYLFCFENNQDPIMVYYEHNLADRDVGYSTWLIKRSVKSLFNI